MVILHSYVKSPEGNSYVVAYACFFWRILPIFGHPQSGDPSTMMRLVDELINHQLLTTNMYYIEY